MPAPDAAGPGLPSATRCALPAVLQRRWIAYDSDRIDFARQLYAQHPDGSGLVRLLTSGATDSQPTYSPDGKRIAFTSDRERRPQIFLLDLASGAVRRVTNRVEGADQASFSHDGQWLAFHSRKSIYVIRADGTQEKEVAGAANDSDGYFWPRFTGDDRELVADRTTAIDAVHIEIGSVRTIVTGGGGTTKAPAVSPDGQEVAFHTGCTGPTMAIWTAFMGTTTEVCQGRRLTPPDDLQAERPAWGGSTVIAYERVDKATNAAAIAVLSVEPGIPCVITPVDADSRNPAWSP
jgi:Tol biopolymer transport system component